MKHAVKRIHFVGIGGAGMSGIAEILHNLGYQVAAATRRVRRHPAPGLARHSGAHRPSARAHRQGAGVVTSTAVKADNPEVLAARAAARPGGATRGDAGRADAPEVRHRHRRHAWQDDHHLAGDQHPGRGRPGPDLRHRRPAQRGGRQLAPRAGRVHRRRGRRERRLLPQSEPGAVGRHQHRRGPYGHLRALARAAAPGLRRLPAPHALLRCGGGVRRRPRRAADPAAHRATAACATG
jgi:hypothetical protein